MDLTIIVFLLGGLFLGWSLGANDAANVFGTAVGTRMIRFQTAAIVCGIFVILGAVISGAGTTETLGKLGSINALPGAFAACVAADMAILAAATIRDFPQFYPWYSQKEFTYHGIKQRNRNRLLWSDHTVDGLKTGFTKKAGYNLVASANRVNMRLVSVVLGSTGTEARTSQTQKILDYGFRFFETVFVSYRNSEESLRFPYRKFRRVFSHAIVNLSSAQYNKNPEKIF